MTKKLLIVGSVWPEPNSSAAGTRMMQLIALLKEDNYTITFVSPCTKSDNAFNLESIGVNQEFIQLNDSSFDIFIESLNPDVVLFDRFMTEEQFGWRVAEICPNALRILDTEDLHCLRKARHDAYKSNKTFEYSEVLDSAIAKREIASIYRCDLSLIISEVEMELLKTQFKIDEALLHYLPFLLEPLIHIESLLEFHTREHFIAIGNCLHAPNYDAILYLKKSIWPLIRQQLPKAELHIYGAYMQQKAMQLHNEKEGFLVKGFVDDAHAVMQEAKVCLVSLRFGAGLKGKLITAMQSGTPCIMTSIGAEGMFGNELPNGFIEDSVESFVSRAVELYQDKIQWEEKQKQGFKVLTTRFNKNDFKTPFLNKMKHIINHLKEHRLKNFTGAMLQHHTLQSTKYMSRWIEEKNKN